MGWAVGLLYCPSRDTELQPVFALSPAARAALVTVLIPSDTSGKGLVRTPAGIIAVKYSPSSKKSSRLQLRKGFGNYSLILFVKLA